ncbi:uncharacterized protein Z520_11771 [Fonsecaea multimorphosa CBS 102226]|uniref:DUF1868 domain-containing protein n=1 Tax=Fonsecaea multimorphosa CBS 102226 TaxID=1442371 RepID=A0A0D2I5D2_9EURO|nr:uncharacterized protein Z520_11771 [Fonsecaea multimorphosa CBS 102226]KIX92451.1 hypothetical protein Z520_11771 [Fonsecaea multimorphosa CBS 102226]OAL19568.1 hypothetical protein AYO22_09730 [Fonsecaea multimorphosa]
MANSPESNPQAGLPRLEYPVSIGRKFDADGKVLPFPGNTIICHLSPDHALYRATLGLHDALESHKLASLYTLLPPESWHMTVFEGVTDQTRKPHAWPADLPLDAPLDRCTDLFKEKLKGFDFDSEPPFQLTVVGYDPLIDGIALTVVPASAADEARLRGLRDRLSELLQLRHPTHDWYSFHISLAYILRRLDNQQHQELRDFLEEYRPKLPLHFELGAPEFCTFEDMFAFSRRFYLGKRS